MFNASPIDKIVASLRKMEEKLRLYESAKAAEEATAYEVARRANTERTRASAIALNLRTLLGEKTDES